MAEYAKIKVIITAVFEGDYPQATAEEDGWLLEGDSTDGFPGLHSIYESSTCTAPKTSPEK
jgi:hypothetical protein